MVKGRKTLKENTKMNKLNKFLIGISAVGTGLVAAISHVGAEILPIPTYSGIVNASTTGFAGSLLADLLPWAGFLALITIVGIALSAVVKKVLSAFSRIAGNRRRGRGRRR
jgi:hypothetical protein